MSRALLLVSTLAAFAACKLAPSGRCSDDAQCASGLRCSGGVCVGSPLQDVGGACTASSDCVSWATCETGICVLAPGACLAAVDCPVFATCTDHACVLLSGRCSADADCPSWSTCNVKTNACTLAAGRCGTDADCPLFQVCGGDHTCSGTALDPAGVALFGTLGDPSGATGGACDSAVAALTDPARPAVGFGCATVDARIAPNGTIVFRDGTTAQKLRRLVRDALTWDATQGRWLYPSAPLTNDASIATPACTGVIQRWTMKAGTGDVLHSCDGATWYDASGAARFTEPAGFALLSWNGSDAKLVGGGTAFAVVDATGNRVDVALSPGVAWDTSVARANGTGFWLALLATASGAGELWLVGGDGAATLAGVYPAYAGIPGAPPVLDAAGALYASFATGTGSGIVVRRAPGAAVPETVYDDRGILGSWTANPSAWNLRLEPPGVIAGP
jgi:hypothetical protein